MGASVDLRYQTSGEVAQTRALLPPPLHERTFGPVQVVEKASHFVRARVLACLLGVPMTKRLSGKSKGVSR